MIISGDGNGTIKFTEVRLDGEKLIAKTISQISTLSNLKDFVVMKAKSKDLLIIVLNAFGSVQSFSTEGAL